MMLPTTATLGAPAQLDNLLSVEPIFINSSFRTGSTWLWLKFRSATTTLSYCEFFNEALATLSRRTAHALGPGTWASKHPPSAPYFLEYLPLLAEAGGIPGFTADMSLHSFVPSEGVGGPLSAAEEAYIALLIAHAREKRKIPVLTCTRTLGRSKAIKRSFDCKMLYLHRNLFHQWASYSYQKITGNSYFINTIEETFASTRHDPFLSTVSDWFSVRSASAECTNLFLAFLAMHLYLAAVGHDAADLTLDMTAIAADAELARSTSDTLSQLIFAPIDLSDAKLKFECVSLPAISRPVLIDTVHQFTKLMANAQISERGLGFARSAAEDALAEWDRYEFYARGLRSISASKIAEIDAKATAAAAEVAACQEQMTAFDHSAQQSQAGLIQERDTYHSALARTQQQLAESTARYAAKEAEAQELGQVRQELGQARQELEARTAERDQLAATLGGERQAGEVVAAERDALFAEKTALQATAQDLEKQKEAIAAESSQLRERLDAAESKVLNEGTEQRRWRLWRFDR